MTSLIALMGFFVWVGTAYAPVNAEQIPSQAVPETAKVAVAQEVSVERDEPKQLSVKLTAYNAVPEQTDGNPAITASGAASNPEVVAARSQDLAADLPFGTIISIEAPESQSLSCGYSAVDHLIGYRVIADTTHIRKTKQIDVLLNPTETVTMRGVAVNPSLALGICNNVTITVVGKINVRDIPETQAELSSIVTSSKLALK